MDVNFRAPESHYKDIDHINVEEPHGVRGVPSPYATHPCISRICFFPLTSCSSNKILPVPRPHQNANHQDAKRPDITKKHRDSGIVEIPLYPGLCTISRGWSVKEPAQGEVSVTSRTLNVTCCSESRLQFAVC